MAHQFKFWRKTLARRLFTGFATITFSMLLIIMGALYVYMQHPLGRDLQAEFHKGRAFTINYTARLWHKPNELNQFAKQLEIDFGAKFTITDIAGRSLYDNQKLTCRSHIKTLEIVHPDTKQKMGKMTACSTIQSQWFLIAKMLLPIELLLFALLLGAWYVARSLTRPIKELADVAENLGNGDLTSRATIATKEGGELAVLGRVFNEMAARIEQQIKEQRTLLAAVSHELRTPLGHLRLLIEMGRDGNWKPERLDQLEREVLEMDDLVDQLLVSSRLNFDLQDTQLLSCIDIIIETLERTGIDPTLLNVQTEASILCDATLIHRALANLIRNAEQHGGGVTQVLVLEQESHIFFFVEDNGPGVPSKAREELFQPFVQSKEHDTQGALGLGLFLIKRIAQAHNGIVRIEHVNPTGARIGFGIPVKS